MKRYEPQDIYFQKAKKMGYKARSVFKLMAIQEKFKIIRFNDFILDLGAYPGSWSQYLSQIIGNKGKIIAVDLQIIDLSWIKNIEIFQGDIFNYQNDFYEKILEEHHKKFFDVIVADLAPKTTGIKDLDIQNSLDLNCQVLEICKKYLKKDWFLVSKIFQGEGTDLMFKKFKKNFQKINIFKPSACRQRSYETFIIGKK